MSIIKIDSGVRWIAFASHLAIFFVGLTCFSLHFTSSKKDFSTALDLFCSLLEGLGRPIRLSLLFFRLGQDGGPRMGYETELTYSFRDSGDDVASSRTSNSVSAPDVSSRVAKYNSSSIFQIPLKCILFSFDLRFSMYYVLFRFAIFASLCPSLIMRECEQVRQRFTAIDNCPK